MEVFIAGAARFKQQSIGSSNEWRLGNFVACQANPSNKVLLVIKKGNEMKEKSYIFYKAY